MNTAREQFANGQPLCYRDWYGNAVTAKLQRGGKYGFLEVVIRNDQDQVIHRQMAGPEVYDQIIQSPRFEEIPA